MTTAAARLKYEVHYSSEILFLEPVPVKIINEQKSFLPAALHHGIPFSLWETVNIQCVWKMPVPDLLLWLFYRGTCWKRTLMKRKTSFCEFLRGYILFKLVFLNIVSSLYLFCFFKFNIAINITLWTIDPGLIVPWDFDIATSRDNNESNIIYTQNA